MKPVDEWRNAKAGFEASPGPGTAVSLQVKTRNLRVYVRKHLTVIEGGKHETGLRHRD